MTFNNNVVKLRELSHTLIVKRVIIMMRRLSKFDLVVGWKWRPFLTDPAGEVEGQS